MNPIRYIFGKDVFIAYGRGDGIRYAAALADRLSAQGLRVALDQWGCQPDEQIPWRLRLTMRLANCLVVVGSDWAGKSAHVAEEVTNFPKRTRPVIPISFDGSAERAIWFAEIKGVPVEAQTAEELQRGEPSAGCINRIVNSIRYNRQETRVRRAFMFASLLLLTLIAITFLQIRKSNTAVENARLAEVQLALETKRAEERVGDAQTKLKSARDLTSLAQSELNGAIVQRRTAEEKAQAANTARVAARALELAALARAQADTDPDLALSLANQSLDLGDTAEGASALRATLAMDLTEFTLLHPKGKISALSFSRDGKYIVTSGTDRTARLWNPATGLQVRLIGPLEGSGHAFLSADEKFLVNVSREFTGYRTEVWSVETGKWLWSFTGKPVRNATAAPGQLAVVEDVYRLGESGSYYSLRDLHDGTFVRRIGVDPSTEFEDIVLSHTGHWLAIGRFDFVTVWDIRSGTKTQFSSGSRGGLDKVFFSPDDQFVGATFENGQTVLWKLDSPKAELWLEATGHDGRPKTATITRGEQLLVTVGDDGKVNTHYTNRSGSSRPSQTNIHSEGRIRAAAVSTDGLYAVTSGFTDKVARIWKLNPPPQWEALRQSLVGHKGPIHDIVFSPDDSRIATASEDGSARLWRRSPILHIQKCPRMEIETSSISPWSLTPEATTMKMNEIDKHWLTTTQRLACGSATQGSRGAVNHLSFSPRWPYFVAASETEASLGKALESGAVPRRAPPKGGYRFAKWAPDGAFILSAGYADKSIELWNPFNGERWKVLKVSEKEPVRDAAMNKNGSRILAYAFEQFVRLWDQHGVEISPPLKHEQTVTHAEFSPDGSRIVTTDLAGSVNLWSANSGKKMKSLRLLDESKLLSVAKFSEDGKMIVVGGDDGRIHALDSTTLDTIQIFDGHSDAIGDVMFSPDGQILLSIDTHAIVRVWDVRTAKVLAEIIDSADTLPSARLSISPFAGYFAVSAGKAMRIYQCDFCGSIANARSAARDRLQLRKFKVQVSLEALPVPPEKAN